MPPTEPRLADAQSLLVVTQNWLGDVLFSAPALRALRKKYPGARIVCLGPARVGDPLRHNPHVTEVWALPPDGPLSWMSYLGLWSRMRRARFDAVIFFHRSRSLSFLTYLAGIPVRAGYRKAGRRRFLTLDVTEPIEPMHKIDYFLRLLEKLGIPSDDRWLDYRITAEEEARSRELLKREGLEDGEPYAVIHAGGNWDLKRWPVASFIEWAKIYLEREKGKLLVCGTGEEAVLAESIGKACDAKRVINLSGRTSLPELAAILKQARFLLSNDSGPIHLAASQRTPILGLYGPTSPRLTGPVSPGPMRLLWKDVGCAVPCYFRSCDHRVCLEELTPREVYERVEELVAL